MKQKLLAKRLDADLHIQSPPSLKFEAQQLEQAYSQEQYQIRIRI